MADLPIEYTKRPWKHKYLDEETPVLNRRFIFGKYDDGSVGISDKDTDVFSFVPQAVAEEIVASRNAFVDVVIKHFGV